MRKPGCLPPDSARAIAIYPGEPAPVATEQWLASFARHADGLYRWRGDPLALAGAGPIAAEDRLRTAAARLPVPVTLVRRGPLLYFRGKYRRLHFA